MNSNTITTMFYYLGLGTYSMFSVESLWVKNTVCAAPHYYTVDKKLDVVSTSLNSISFFRLSINFSHL